MRNGTIDICDRCQSDNSEDVLLIYQDKILCEECFSVLKKYEKEINKKSKITLLLR